MTIKDIKDNKMWKYVSEMWKYIIEVLFLSFLFCLLHFVLPFNIDIFYSIIFSLIVFFGVYKLLSLNFNYFSQRYDEFNKKLFFIIANIPIHLVSLLFASLILLYNNEILRFLQNEIKVGYSFISNTITFLNTFFGIDDNDKESKDLEIIKTILHFLISYVFVVLFIFGVIYLKAIINSIKEFWTKDIVLKVVSREFINDVLNARSPISYNKGIKGIIVGLAGEGISLKTFHFVKLLGISASIKPDVVYGCWNTVWYKLESVFEITDNVGQINITEKWRSYFDNLDNVYTEKKDSKHKRIFIVDDTQKILTILSNIKNLKNVKDEENYWYHLLKKHNDWGVKEIIFINYKELEDQITDGINTNIPNWRDFAIFKKNFLCLFGFCLKRKLWAFAQEEEPKNRDNATVIYDTGKTVKEVYNFFFDDPNNRWQSKIKFMLMNDKLKDMKEETILEFNDNNIEELLNARDKKIIEKQQRKLHNNWAIISDNYHNEKEEDFLINLLKTEKDKSILDPAFGSGYLVDLLLKEGFRHIFTSDIPSNNLISKKIDNDHYYDDIKYFYSYFQNLRTQTIKKDYDNIVVIGASLSYCQNWEKNKIIELDKKEIFKSLEGLKSVLNQNGTLYIGNAKIYNEAYRENKNKKIKPFWDKQYNDLRVMRWTLEFDWEKLEKKWTCELFDKDTQELKEKFYLNSHLFTNEMLKDYCLEYFNDVEIIVAPEDCPEDIIKCKNPKP